MLFTMCNKSKNIGGYNENYKVSEVGKITDINVNEFYDYQKKYSEESNRKNLKSNNKEIILKIEHENKNIDLYNKKIIIFEGNSNVPLYSSKYQDRIKLNMGFNKRYNSNFRIYVFDDENKTIHKFFTELTYPIFEDNVKSLDIKLFENEKSVSGNEVLYYYKITNLKSELEQMGYKTD